MELSEANTQGRREGGERKGRKERKTEEKSKHDPSETSALHFFLWANLTTKETGP